MAHETPKSGSSPNASGDGLTRRQLLGAGAGALAGLALPTPAAADPPTGDRRLSREEVMRWFDTAAPMRPVREGNDVTALIDGQETFSSMASAIALTGARNDHFVYMLNWHMTDGFHLRPNERLIDLLTRASNNNVQVRAMLWDQQGFQNNAEVGRINALANGAAIRDNRTLNFGSHHQKILVVNGLDGLIGFCGGIDFHPDRLHATGVAPNQGFDNTQGAPLHDVHCKIAGPAAGDLLLPFVSRWLDHPDHIELDRRKGALRGSPIFFPTPIGGKTNWVQVGFTFGNGSRHPGIANTGFFPFLRPAGYSFAPFGEQTAARMILRGIQQAEEFIYVEDQYFVDTAPNSVNLNIRAALMAKLRSPRFRTLIAVIPHSDITTHPQGNDHKREFINALEAAGGRKVRVYNLKPAGNAHTYVHSKTWIFDDQYAIIGSANCCRRSFTHDSEVVAGICDQGDGASLWFPHRLRMRLWAEHLKVGEDRVRNAMAGIALWDPPRAGSAVEFYVKNVDTGITPDWDTFVDPDGS